jgi:hypothetical protein
MTGLQVVRARPCVTEMASWVGIMNKALIGLRGITPTLPSRAGDVEIPRPGILGALTRLPAGNRPDSLENRAGFTDIPT